MSIRNHYVSCSFRHWLLFFFGFVPFIIGLKKLSELSCAFSVSTRNYQTYMIIQKSISSLLLLLMDYLFVLLDSKGDLLQFYSPSGLSIEKLKFLVG